MIHTSEKTDRIWPAVLEAQKHFKKLRRNRRNPHFNSKYADLDAVLDAVRPALQAVGVVITWGPGVSPSGHTLVETRFTHAESQQFISCYPGAQGKDGNAQTVGSIITYLRRYGLGALAGITTDDDDDGESSMPRGTAQTVARRPFPGGGQQVGPGAPPPRPVSVGPAGGPPRPPTTGPAKPGQSVIPGTDKP